MTNAKERGLAAIFAAVGGPFDGQPTALPAPPRAPAAAAPITAERAEAIVDAAQAAAGKERGAEAGARLGASMQRYLAKVLPAPAIEANALELELRVAPGDGAQLRLAKVCARQIIQLCGEQKAAPAIQLARAVASGGVFTRADHRPPVQARVLAAVRRG